MNKTTAILLAAGKSERIGKIIPKPFLQLGGKAVYRYSLEVFLAHPEIDEVILVVPWNFLAEEQKIIDKEAYKKPVKIIVGGDTRFESVYNALNQMDNGIKNVFIHDTARPFITKGLIDLCFKNFPGNKAVSCAIQSSDTIVNGEVNKSAELYPDRSKVLRIQTPQIFDVATIKRAYQLAKNENKTNFTDDSGIIHFYKLAPVILVPGCVNNFKITYSRDLQFAELMLKRYN